MPDPQTGAGDRPAHDGSGEPAAAPPASQVRAGGRLKNHQDTVVHRGRGGLEVHDRLVHFSPASAPAGSAGSSGTAVTSG